MPYGAPVTPDLVAVLQRETSAIGELLAAGDLGTAVPSCPGWTLADLGRHTAGVHLWAAEALRGTAPPGGEDPGPADDADVPAWYAAAAATLLDTLARTHPATPCWTFHPGDRSAAFWQRRQAHETTLHRWDAEHALVRTAGIDTAVALDGIDEVLDTFLPRQVRLGRIASSTDVVDLVPDEGRAVRPVTTGDPGSHLVGAVRGPAGALLLLLWRRIGPTDPRLVVTGDPAAVHRCLDRPLTP